MNIISSVFFLCWTGLGGGGGVVWTPDPTDEKGSGEKPCRKCLERWNAAVSVDEGTNITSAKQHSSSINDRKRIYGRT